VAHLTNLWRHRLLSPTHITDILKLANDGAGWEKEAHATPSSGREVGAGAEVWSGKEEEEQAQA
jgi:hypothetical protein